MTGHSTGHSTPWIERALPHPSPSKPMALPPTRQQRSLLERMPKWLICVPLAVQWLWLSLVYRSTTVASCANPAITSGGLVGEGKLEYFEAMGPLAKAATATSCGVTANPTLTAGDVQAAMSRAGLGFPVMVKPNLGLCGYGVRREADLAGLLRYLRAFPAGEVVVLQQYLPQDGEAGVFYARDPGVETGRIIGLALRYYPSVTGDGKRSLAQLVAQDARARRLHQTVRHQAAYNPQSVPAAGEVVRLATIGSTRVGGLYRNGAAFITPALTDAIDAIAQDMADFHFGRFDIRFDSLQQLGAGQGFCIMEVNGAGSEAIEAWDPDISLLTGLKMIFAKQRVLFHIGHAMRLRGHPPISLSDLNALNQRQQRLIARYPPSN